MSNNIIEPEKQITCTRKKNVYLISEDDKNINFKVELVRIIVTDEKLEPYTKNIHRNYEYNDFIINSIDHIRKNHVHVKTKQIKGGYKETYKTIQAKNISRNGGTVRTRKQKSHAAKLFIESKAK